MNPGNPRILTCPHCGKMKQVLSLVSGNTCGMRMWTDIKREYPMLPQPSFVQKCPHCGGYFLLSRQKGEKYGNGLFCLNEGRLTYIELKDAYKNLSSELKLKKEKKMEILYYLLWGFNDKFWRNDEPTITAADRENEKYEEYINYDSHSPHKKGTPRPPMPEDLELFMHEDEKDAEKGDEIINEEFVIPESEQPKPLEVPSEVDLAFHEEIVSELLRYITDPLLRAEYLREIGQFEEASLVLKDANPEDEFLKFYKQKIKELITKRDRSVVELIYDYGFTIVM